MDFDDTSVLGCVVIALFALLAIVVSIAIGVFFGAGFGLLACAAFIVFALIFFISAFKQAK